MCCVTSVSSCGNNNEAGDNEAFDCRDGKEGTRLSTPAEILRAQKTTAGKHYHPVSGKLYL